MRRVDSPFETSGLAASDDQNLRRRFRFRVVLLSVNAGSPSPQQDIADPNLCKSTPTVANLSFNMVIR
jgi:hypothetical protein